MGEINELISRIKQKKELAGIADSIVRESLEDYVRKEGIDLNAIGMREEKIVVKEIRKGLRKYAGRFESSADRKKFLDKENWRGLLESHSSTRERIENYPELKANQNFLDLQSQLTDTENKIQASRRFYNGNVRDFNTKLQVFPNNIVAGMLGFTQRKFFELDNEAERQNVQVKF